MDYPLHPCSICETDVDYVVKVDAIGDPKGIVSGTTRITRDPVSLRIADLTTRAICGSGLLQDGLSFQTGAGGISLAVGQMLHQKMLDAKVQGSFLLGGTTGYLVDMLESGCFRKIMDVQCFDLKAVESLKRNPNHVEVSASHYASPTAKSSLCDSLDVVILGGTQIDLNFNVNIHTDSNGYIIGGSGGHSDIAKGGKLAVVVAPLSRTRLSTVVQRALTVSTPGDTVDLFITQYGMAVNPKHQELKERLLQKKLPVMDIQEFYDMAQGINGEARMPRFTNRVVAEVIYRDGSILNRIYQVAER